MTKERCEITDLTWGRIEITTSESRTVFKDCKAGPGFARAWDWNETGTRHKPGIQVADVKELVKIGVTALVLSRGMELMLGTCPETLEYLADRGIKTHILETTAAAELFNKLTKAGSKVGGLFHSTC